MYQIIYASEATESFSSDQLAELLATARRRNRINRLTGMLVFCNQQFLQLLEGDPADVIATYDRIAHDPRHQDLDGSAPWLLNRWQKLCRVVNGVLVLRPRRATAPWTVRG